MTDKNIHAEVVEQLINGKTKTTITFTDGSCEEKIMEGNVIKTLTAINKDGQKIEATFLQDNTVNLIYWDNKGKLLHSSNEYSKEDVLESNYFYSFSANSSEYIIEKKAVILFPKNNDNPTIYDIDKDLFQMKPFFTEEGEMFNLPRAPLSLDFKSGNSIYKFSVNMEYTQTIIRDYFEETNVIELPKNIFVSM